MAILQNILMGLEVICCLLLIGIILLQKSSGQGLGTAFGSSMGESLFGARMGNVLTKWTIILAILFMSNTVLLALMAVNTKGKSLLEKYAQPGAGALRSQPIAPPPAAPSPLSAPAAPPAVPVAPTPPEVPSAPVSQTEVSADGQPAGVSAPPGISVRKTVEPSPMQAGAVPAPAPVQPSPAGDEP